MKFSRIVFLALRFLQAKKWQYFLVFLGIFLGTLLFFVFSTVTKGLQTSLNETFSESTEFITIQKNPKTDIELTDKAKIELEQLQEIDKIYRETAFVVPFTFDIPIPFSNSFSLDLYFLYGVEDEFFAQMQEFSTPENSIPVFINPLSVDLINSFVQSMLENVSLSSNIFSKKQVSATFGTSTFIPTLSRKEKKQEELFVSGFSSIAPLIGISIPLSKAQEIKSFFGEDTQFYSRFHVIKNENFSKEEVKKLLRDKGFIIKSREAASDKITEITQVLQWVLLISSSIILFLSFLFLFSVLHIVITEHKKTVGILQAMGFSHYEVIILFTLQGGGVSLLAALAGLSTGIGVLAVLSTWWDNNISLFLFPSSIFTVEYYLFFIVLLLNVIAIGITLFIILRKQIKTPILHNILGISSAQ